MTYHADLPLQAGDSWDIPLTVLKADGTVFDLTNAVVNWILISPDGEEVTPDSVVVATTDATAGTVLVSIPAADTSPLPGGRYFDCIRVYAGGKAYLFLPGFILVSADPFLLIPT